MPLGGCVVEYCVQAKLVVILSASRLMGSSERGHLLILLFHSTRVFIAMKNATFHGNAMK